MATKFSERESVIYPKPVVYFKDFQMNHKINNVYNWRYTPAFLEKLEHDRNGGTTYWAVSRICICRQKQNGELYLEDTFWGSSCENVEFYPADMDHIELTFLGNLDDYDNKGHYAKYSDLSPYYKQEDILDLNHGNNSRGNLYLKKGATRNLGVMRSALEAKKENISQQIKYLISDLDRTENDIKNLIEENKDSIYV